jgi:hypothetical protein
MMDPALTGFCGAGVPPAISYPCRGAKPPAGRRRHVTSREIPASDERKEMIAEIHKGIRHV